MSKKKVVFETNIGVPGDSTLPVYFSSAPPQGLYSVPSQDELGELGSLINEIELNRSGIELLNMRGRILYYLRKLQEKG